MTTGDVLTDEDYQAIAQFRAELRRFLKFSDEAALKAGLAPKQHQMLLAIRGFGSPSPPSIGELAESLQIRHNSAVELVDRLEKSDYVYREPSTQDARRVLIRLTPHGTATLAQLTAAHRREHHELHRMLQRLVGAEPGT